MRVIFFLIFVFFAQVALAMNSRNVTIMAEPNMDVALTKIARLYSQQFNVITTLNFASSAELIGEIDLGEPADVFISSHTISIETLRQKGLVDVYNIGYIARDELVLVASKDAVLFPDFNVRDISFESAMNILNQNKATLLLDGDGSASGKFAADFIARYSLTDLVLVTKLNEDKTSLLAMVKKEPQQYALLLKSQVKKSDDIKVLVVKKDRDIFYQALVIAGDNMDVAREFLKFLKSNKAKEILRSSGFIVD